MNKYYGGLISASMPLNILTFFLSPIYMLVDNKPFLTQLTFGIKMFNYAFILMPLAVVFIFFNALCIPFAYLRTILIKVKLARSSNLSCVEIFIWILIGLPLLLVYQIFDLIDFIKWSTHMEDPNEKENKHYIQKNNFELFYKLLKGMEGLDEEI